MGRDATHVSRLLGGGSEQAQVAVALVVALLMLGACSGSPAFQEEHLAAIAPGAADAPPGTSFRANISGPIDRGALLGFFREEGANRPFLEFFEPSRFLAGYRSSFQGDDQLLGAAFSLPAIQVQLLLFRDVSIGAQFFEVRRANLDESFPGGTVTTGIGLGEASFLVTSKQGSTQQPSLVVVWRRSNMHVGISAYGPIRLPELSSLMRGIDHRASAIQG